MSVCEHMRPQRLGLLDVLELVVGMVVNHLLWILGIGSSKRAVHVLNHCPSLPPKMSFYYTEENTGQKPITICFINLGNRNKITKMLSVAREKDARPIHKMQDEKKISMEEKH